MLVISKLNTQSAVNAVTGRKTHLIRSDAKFSVTAYSTRLFIREKDKKKKNKVEWAGKTENRKAEFVTAGEAWKRPAWVLKCEEGLTARSGFWSDRKYWFASVVQRPKFCVSRFRSSNVCVRRSQFLRLWFIGSHFLCPWLNGFQCLRPRFTDSVSASSVQRIQLFVDFSVYLFSIQRVWIFASTAHRV